MSQSKIQAGLFGFGVVGEGLYRLLRETNYSAINLRTIVVRETGKRRLLPESRFAFDKRAILDDPEIQLVIELISDPDEAFTIVKEALEQGKDVITANKKMLAEHLEELVALQALGGGVLLYEASVCGSIPIIQTLDGYFAWDPITRIEGIFNGTGNFILSETEKGKDYLTALREAQLAGFAEADPTLDVGSFDPKYKLILLALHAFGQIVHPDDVLNLGIQRLTQRETDFAKRFGYVIRQVAWAQPTDKGLEAGVIPTFLPATDRLASIAGEENAVILHSQTAGTQVYQGKGAGAEPTALAVLGDIERYRSGSRYRYPKGEVTGEVNAQQLAVYVRVPEGFALPDFETVWEETRLEDARILLGEIRTETLQALDRVERDNLFVAQLPAVHGLLYRSDHSARKLVEAAY